MSGAGTGLMARHYLAAPELRSTTPDSAPTNGTRILDAYSQAVIDVAERVRPAVRRRAQSS